MTAIESALEAVNATVSGNEDAGQLLIAAKVRGLLRGYDARWIDAGYVPLEVEKYIEAPLINVTTERSSRTWKIGGVRDLLCTRDDRLILFDAKTTSESIEDPNAPYWRQLVVESQPSHYMLIDWLNGRKIDTAVWDVVRKPQIRPKKLTKADRAGIAASRKYFGEPVSMDDLERLQTEENESLEMYEIRLAHECTIEKPQSYFQRKGVPRLDSEIHDYAEQLWDIGQDMLATRNSGRHYRNSGACIQFGSACPFLGICSGHDSSTSPNWTTKPFVHNELPEGIGGDGRDILTNSRIRTYQTCKRKHQLQYETAIERLDEEEREALWMGRLWHVALAAWWSFQMGESNEHRDTNGCSVIGADQPSAC